MYAEVFAAYSVLVFLLFYLAEISNKKPVGIFAALFLILLGVWFIGDPTLYIRSGETKLISNTLTGELLNSENTTLVGNLTGYSSLQDNVTDYIENTTGYHFAVSAGSSAGTLIGNETLTYDYTALTVPYLPISFGHVLSILFIGSGIYLFVAYSVDTFTQPTR